MTGDKAMHCYYVPNVLMLYCEIHCPGYGTDVEAVYRELGGGGGGGGRGL